MFPEGGGEKCLTSSEGEANNFRIGQLFTMFLKHIFSCFVGILGTFNSLVKGGMKIDLYFLSIFVLDVLHSHGPLVKSLFLVFFLFCYFFVYIFSFLFQFILFWGVGYDCKLSTI